MVRGAAAAKTRRRWRRRAYINAIEANGSTNLHDALVAALRQPVAEGALPLVLFLTDGRATDGVTSEVGSAAGEVKVRTSTDAGRSRSAWGLT
ncbi:MAG: hypothetical protein R3B49_07025 [Phycisphaerales bacterium]